MLKAECRESCFLVAQSCPTLLPHGPYPSRLLCLWDFSGKNTGVGWHFRLQGFFLGFLRQEYWSGLAFPSPGVLPGSGIKPMSPLLAGGFFTTEKWEIAKGEQEADHSGIRDPLRDISSLFCLVSLLGISIN